MTNDQLRNQLALRLSEIETGRDGAESAILDALSALHLARIDLLDGSLDRGELGVLVQTLTNELMSAVTHVRSIREPFEVISFNVQSRNGGARTRPIGLQDRSLLDPDTLSARVNATKNSDELDALVAEVGGTLQQSNDAETMRLVTPAGALEWDGTAYTWTLAS
jgi:hypothetical protein